MPFVRLDEVEERELLPGLFARMVHSELMTFAYWRILQGSVLPEHSHPQEQVATMLEGEFELVINGERKVLRPGMVAIIPPHAVHSGTAMTECRILDAFYPLREDYLELGWKRR